MSTSGIIEDKWYVGNKKELKDFLGILDLEKNVDEFELFTSRKLVKEGEMSENKEFEVRGMCWLLQRCDWWNPTLDMICKGGGDYCIKCWKFKK